jgi:beta-1,4-mannosyltransferase
MNKNNTVVMYPSARRGNDNPFIEILSVALEKEGVGVENFSSWKSYRSVDAFHFHWPENIFWSRIAGKSNFVAELISNRVVKLAERCKSEGKPVVWTVHNLRPHEKLSVGREKIYNSMMDRLLPLVTDLIVMSQDTIGQIRATFPALSRARIHFVPHPHYQDYFKKFMGSTNLRDELAIPIGCPVFCSIGRLRPYKNILDTIDVLQKAFKNEFRLIVAGSGDRKYIAEIAAKIGTDRRIILIDRALRDEEFVEILSFSDIAIFNFSSILNSGSVIAALSVGTISICPASGALISLQEAMGSDWVRCFNPPLTRDWLQQNVKELILAQKNAKLDLRFMAPEVIASAHKAIYFAKDAELL